MTIGPFGTASWQDLVGPHPATDPRSAEQAGAASGTADPQAANTTAVPDDAQLETQGVQAREGEAGGLINVLA